jgi:hypothetical protein
LGFCERIYAFGNRRGIAHRLLVGRYTQILDIIFNFNNVQSIGHSGEWNIVTRVFRDFTLSLVESFSLLPFGAAFSIGLF